MFMFDGRPHQDLSVASPCAHGIPKVDWAVLGAVVRQAASLAVAVHLTDTAAEQAAETTARCGEGTPHGRPVNMKRRSAR
jgi:hypothetical protein